MASLARRGALGLILVVAASAPSTAHAFCRTTTAAVPPSYNSATKGCFTEGLLLYWKNACVGYSIQSAGSTKIPAETANGIIDQAFATWTAQNCVDSGAKVGIDVQNVGAAECAEVRYNTEGPNQNLVVFRDTTWPYNDPNNTLGLTTVTFNADTGEIYDADMEINATGSNLSTGDPVPRTGYDLLSVMTHEAGHFYGLGHAQTSSSTMYASYRQGSSALRSLSADDVAGLCSIYPNATQRVVSPSVSADGILAAGPCDAAPRHGFGSDCASNEAPKDSSGGCTAAPTRTTTFSLSAIAALVGVATFVVRRRRR